MNPVMRFGWFWTFWHWSKESHRVGILLRDPLHGLGGNWDTWFRREASDADIRIIAEIGHTEKSQREFIAWIFRHWSRAADRNENHSMARFVTTQLARVAPFNNWQVFGKYRANYGASGVSAIVLTQGSMGEAEDVRPMEAVALPDFSGGTGPKLICEGFQADDTDLGLSRQSAISMFGGKGGLLLFLSWALSGQRPHPRWLRIILALGWLGAGALILRLRFGPDPGEELVAFVVGLIVLWCGLAGVALATLAAEGFHLWRDGKKSARRLETSRVWLCMSGGLMLKGGSAGLAFCLNTLLSIHRAHPRVLRKSWVWQNIFRKLRKEGPFCAATGVTSQNGHVNAVVLEPKFRACVQHPQVRHILTPNQRDAKPSVMDRIQAALQRVKPAPVVFDTAMLPHLGYASASPSVRLHRCSHVAQALMALSGLNSITQLVFSAVAVGITIVILIAAPDLWCIVRPPPVPIPVASFFSPATNALSVVLATDRPDYFQVVLESEYWINRCVAVEAADSLNTAPHAEIPLLRATRPATGDANDGTVWLERRRLFLGRDFKMGQRVGKYSVSELTRLGQ